MSFKPLKVMIFLDCEAACNSNRNHRVRKSPHLFIWYRVWQHICRAANEPNDYKLNPLEYVNY